MRQKTVSYFQAAYYFLTGLWPLVHIQSFIEVSGPKSDLWLVKMVGLLTTSIAITILYAASNHLRTALVLGITSALSYTFVDVYYSINNIIPDIYLADAVLEIIIIGLLIFSKRK